MALYCECRMLWIYERSDRTLRVEARLDNANKEYLLVIRRIDGTEQVERFPDAASFHGRITHLEKQLDTGDWQTRTTLEPQDGATS